MQLANFSCVWLVCPLQNQGALEGRLIFSHLHHFSGLIPLLGTYWLLLFTCSVLSDSATPWTVAHQVPLPWDSPGKNTGVGCHALFQGNLPDPGIEPAPLMSPALAGGFFTTSTTWVIHFQMAKEKPALRI